MVDRIFHRVRLMHPNHSRIALGMFSVAALVFAAKLISMAKEKAVARRFGVSGEVDAYLLAFTLVTWLPVILWSVGNVVLVPRLVTSANKPSEQADFVAELNGITLLLGLLATLLIVVIGPWLVGLIAGSWDATTQQLVRTFIWQLAPIALLQVVIGFLSIRLLAREKQGYTFLEAMPAFGILAFVLLAPPEIGPATLVWGTLAGVGLQVGLLMQMTRKVHRGLGRIAFSHRSPQWEGIYAAFGVMIIGQLMMGLATPIDQVFGARLGEGAIATLGYANRFIALLTGLGATAIARALLPVLSETVAKREFELGREQTFKWAKLMLCAGGLTVVISWFFAPTVVALLFERGAFTAKDTAIVANALQFGLLQLPFYFSGVVLMQWIAARNRLSFLALLAFANVGIKILVAMLLIPVLGIQGIQLSSAAMYFVSMCGCVYVARKVLQ
jgi:putative peptidoglycan lipid II flippase